MAALTLPNAKQVIAHCARAGLLAGDGGGEAPVWFAPHQTIQEHFAARALKAVAQHEQRQNPLHRAFIHAKHTAGYPEGLLALAAQDWWMETFVQLAGLVADPNWLALEVARVNPWLAWWCVAESQTVLEQTRQHIEQRSNGLLRSPRVADRRAVETLAQIHNERVVPTLWAALCDEADADVAQLMVSVLVEQGEAVRPLVEKALHGADKRLKRVALRYISATPDDPQWLDSLSSLLGQPLVWIPPGPFLMGSDQQKDKLAKDGELPQHTITLPGYWIGRYPVTVAQFRVFVAQSAYQVDDEKWSQDPDTHPVRYVTWHDAQAYCRWLAETTSLPLALPTEAEWEKAARGSDGRLYPWGNEWNATRCNNRNRESLFETTTPTTPVGWYSPRGDSPYGCADMVGNVWGWCLSKYKPYPYKPNDGREAIDQSDDYRVLRGGSFVSGASGARCAFRLRNYPDLRDGRYGFRLVMSRS